MKKNQKEYSLSEIVFVKKKNEKIEDQLNQIRLRINDIGFKNTANIYSISQSSKFGGDLGWVGENSLSKKISEKIFKLKKGELSDPIKMGNNYLILKIDDIKINEIQIDKKIDIKVPWELARLQHLTNLSINSYS